MAAQQLQSQQEKELMESIGYYAIYATNILPRPNGPQLPLRLSTSRAHFRLLDVRRAWRSSAFVWS